MELQWTITPFNALSPAVLYAIMQLRNEVFVVEQNCVYQDADDKDQPALHLCGWDKERLVAYTRIIPPGVSYPEASIGRVVTSPAYRRQGAGIALMNESIKRILEAYKNFPVKIGAQVYLTSFYQSFGFVPCSEMYLEDGIPHIEMILAQ